MDLSSSYILHYTLAMRTAEGVRPLSFKVLRISSLVKVLRGNVDEKTTVSTLYARFWAATNSATSTRVLSLGKALTSGAPPTCKRI